MEILPPPDYPPLQPSVYPQVPTRTSPAILVISCASCVRGDIQKFRASIDSQTSLENFDICDFHEIMIEAIHQPNIQFIKELLNRGLPMDQLYILEAISTKRKDALEVFLQNGWDINQPISKLKPPVLGYYAVVDEEMVAWLLDHGANPNQQCIIDFTPLSQAVETAPISVIQLMLRRGGDTQKGQLLHHAVMRNSDNITVLSLLIEKGVNINSTMNSDYPCWALFSFIGLGTALHKAAELGKVDIVRYLISKGANLEIKDSNGRTALECARMSNRWEVVQVLEKDN